MIDVVFVAWNARDQVLDCIGHLREPDIVASITVVDNASSDGTAAAVRSAHPDVNVIPLPEPLGLAAALNRGARAGTAPFVLYLNDDVLAFPGSVAALLAALRENAGAVAAGGRLVDENLVTQAAYEPQPFPSAATLLGRLLGIARLVAVVPRADRGRASRSSEDVVVVEQLAGACLLVRRSVVERIGGWDERYWFWYEDVDLSRRLSSHGRSLYVPAAAFRHLGGATARRLTRPEGHRRTLHGMLCYAGTHCSRPGELAVALAVLATSVGRAAVRFPTDRPGARLYAEAARDAARTLVGRSARGPAAR
ncbi:MAG: hypothetical protein QOG15_3370 [Solirubrobacteraceae bacterium]|jgi:GT2 family glycosyltransferase|nr:hypothetical protein [Solirubrobacteraceae bacterium]